MPLLEISGLSQRFGGLQAVSDFSFQLGEHELAGLIGPNGAGKTTVFNIVSGFYRPTAGSVVFDGRHIDGLKPHQITALGMARTFQNIRLWNDLTVLDNLRLAHYHQLGYGFWHAVLRTRRHAQAEKKIEHHAREVLEMMQLTAQAEELPRNLPYGLQRRVELARALASKPRLLLLDEPAAGLNSADVEELIGLIRWIHREFKLTIWMIEHQMQVVMTLCQHLTVIDFGRVIAAGEPRQVRDHPEVIKAYLGNAVL
ncbi:MAG: ABC transporter ATP-binding protein [Burkholderiaceae bacterium]|jgi:branched-chain amino acid transport system ATP-binding protein|nr:ABC transporter ATP-binding protein [Burkholderiaceae bacterium]